MRKRIGLVWLAVAVIAWILPAGLAAHDHHEEGGSWTGWVTDSGCGEKGANAGHADCAVRCVKNGAKYALYDPAGKALYVLSNQEDAAKMAGKEVTVKGKLDKEKKAIEVTSMAEVEKK